VGYTTYRHLGYGLLDQESANFVCQPFYNDHTAYAAAIAMMLPVMIGLLGLREYSYYQRISAFVVLVVLIAALVFSYTRAAWLSIAAMLVVFIVIKLKIKFRTLLFLGAGLIVALFLFWTQIYMELEQNRQDASSNFSEQLQSITNISTDASNKERLNRWSCAIRMFNERPVFGWGPGTYMFNYAPFQFSYEKTIISTNFGDMGNAHSEYLGPLAESGVLGTVTFLLMMGFTIYYAIRVYKRATEKWVRTIVLSVLMGLITYYVHGVLNNFLDTDKLSVLFWGYMAIIVALDVYYVQRQPEKEKVSVIGKPGE
jgi:O-antigen ligase